MTRHQRLESAVGQLRGGPRPVFPFHWEIEFPEVFDRVDEGFDAFVGNPPFMGGSRISGSSGASYLDWLLMIHEQSHGNGDLVAHFFRRAFDLLRPGGAFGLIATNTIGQGDTRSTGLRWICNHGGVIYAATRRKKWPGQAAVVVSVVHVARPHVAGRVSRAGIPSSLQVGCVSSKTPLRPPYELDNRPVPIITAYLFHAGGNDDPERLRANAGRGFLGSKVYGQGFIFDDTDTKGVASPIAEMRRLIAKDPRNAERIFPYIGGEEVNDSPTHAHHRYVINFGEMTEQEACKWPDLMEVLEAKVKHERMLLKQTSSREKWWQFERTREEHYRALSQHERVIALPRVSQYLSLVFLKTEFVFSDQLLIMICDRHAGFCLLASRPHEVWARFFSSSMKDDMRYTPSDCFETFPFPKDFEQNPALESAGQTYYEFRAALMVRNNEGLTKTYNRFHDPNERSPDILKLRELHAAMDRAVLDAYGWTELKPTCEFLLDYEDEEDQEPATSNQKLPTRRRRKPWRYRWPDDFRDEVLARLLELNRQRAEEERLSGAAESGRGKSTKKSTKGRKADTKKPDQPEFFES